MQEKKSLIEIFRGVNQVKSTLQSTKQSTLQSMSINFEIVFHETVTSMEFFFI